MTLADAIRKHPLFHAYVHEPDGPQRRLLFLSIAEDFEYSTDARMRAWSESEDEDDYPRRIKQAIRDAAKNDSGRKPGRPKKPTLRAECENLVVKWGGHKHAKELAEVLGRVK